MEWYPGSIEAAVGAVRERDTLLIVLVRDEKEESDKMVENMNSASTAFSDCTCLQLSFGTDTCRQFNVYYPVLIVPSLYVINGAGLCLEVLAGTVESDKLQEVLSTIKQNKADAPPLLIAVPQPAPTQQAAPRHTVQVDPNTAMLHMINQSSTSPPAAPGASEGPSEGVSALSLDDKIRRANELLEKKRGEDAAAEVEKEKERERERRSVGVAIAEQKRSREQEEMRRHGEEMRRNKITQKAEMEAIRAQIARDKAERRGEAIVTSTVTAVPDTTVIDPSKVAVVIKFPATSTTVSQTFQCHDTLGDVVEYAVKQLGKDNFTLWNTHPRKQYKSTDLPLSLASLGLSGTVNLLGMSGKGYTLSDKGDKGKGPAAPSTPAAPPSSTSSSQIREPSSKPVQCRLQFKMLDGSSVVNAFPVDTLLSDAVQWFQTEKSIALGSTSLWCSYPRYEITSEHLAKSLTELAMCPSAVVFVCANTPDNGQVATQNSSFIWGVLFTVLRLPLTLLEVLKSFMFPATSRRRPRPPPLERAEGTNIPASNDASPVNENLRKRSRLDNDTRLDGNIAQLRQGKEGDDEDNNVYNGNSTQLQ